MPPSKSVRKTKKKNEKNTRHRKEQCIFAHDSRIYAVVCWKVSRNLLEQRFLNECNKWTWLSIEQHNKRSGQRFSVVDGRCRTTRGILEFSLNYGASHTESNIGIMGRRGREYRCGRSSPCIARIRNAVLIITVKGLPVFQRLPCATRAIQANSFPSKAISQRLSGRTLSTAKQNWTRQSRQVGRSALQSTKREPNFPSCRPERWRNKWRCSDYSRVSNTGITESISSWRYLLDVLVNIPWIVLR